MRSPASGCRGGGALARRQHLRMEVLRRTVRAGRIARIEAAHRAEQQRAVLGAARERAGLIEARRERDHAVARADAVRRLDPGDAGEARRLADRAAGVGAGRGRQQARRHRSGRAARRAAGHAARVPRIANHAERRVLVAGAHRELVAVELAERDGAGVAEPFEHGRVERAAITLEHPRAGGARQVARDEDVLVRDRHAEQRAVLAARSTRIGGLRLPERQRLVAAQQRAEIVMRGKPCKQMFRELEARDRAVVERAPHLGDAHLVQRLHSITFGTRNRPASTAGALLQVRGALVGLGDGVLAQAQAHRVHRRQRRVERLDAGRVDRAHFLDDAEEVVELREHRVLLASAQLESGQMGDLADVLQGQWHVRNGLCLGSNFAGVGVLSRVKFNPHVPCGPNIQRAQRPPVHQPSATQRFAEAFASLGPLLELKVAPSR